jgi:hypothetical protein
MSNIVKNQEWLPSGSASNTALATGQNYNGSSTALALAERIGAAVMVADRARQRVANDPNFYETFTSAIGRRDWQEPDIRERVRNGQTVADIVALFERAEREDFLRNAPAYSPPKAKDIMACLLNGEDPARLEAEAQMKHRVKEARHAMSKPKIEADIIRFAGWVATMADRGPMAAPLSNRAMIARAKGYAKRVISGLNVNSSIREAEEKIAEAVIAQAAAQNPQNKGKELSDGPRSVPIAPLPMPCYARVSPVAPISGPAPVYPANASRMFVAPIVRTVKGRKGGK